MYPQVVSNQGNQSLWLKQVTDRYTAVHMTMHDLCEETMPFVVYSTYLMPSQPL